MVDLIMEHIQWVFSGIGVFVLGGIGKWLWSKRKNDANKSKGEAGTYSVQQTHSGSGDNVGGDKIVKG